MARLRYMVSFYAVIDFLAIFPYYVAQMSERVDEYDNYLRLLRLLRILKVCVCVCVWERRRSFRRCGAVLEGYRT